MRKRIIGSAPHRASSSDGIWLNLEDLAEVEITSEVVAYPIESALLPGSSKGWRAACSGKQTIRLLFAHPQQLRWISLKFLETDTERTQEYVLRWSPDGGKSYREIVRQQWNFSSPSATCEEEDLHVDLPAVTVIELSIIPDISGEDTFASMAHFRLA